MEGEIIQIDKSTKKVRACPYYSPFKAICVNRRHIHYDPERPSKFPRCSYRGKFSNCDIVDKIIELTLDENNTVIYREYIYIKGRSDPAKLSALETI